MILTNFTDITLPEPIQKAIISLGYITPTSIQEQAIPWLLENNGDLIGLAQTGTGKTAAFGFPVLTHTDIENKNVQSIILCPTRELCIQITKDLMSYAKYMSKIKIVAVYGGAPIHTQKVALKTGAHIVVGTPGRVSDMIRQKALSLGNVKRLILDEADEMLNMGFKEELFDIMSHTPKEKQTLLFSATMPNDVVKIANTFMVSPHKITAERLNMGVENIGHFYYQVNSRDKYAALKRIADMSPKIYGIVFCRTRKETQEIATKLQHDGYNADALHGDLSQNQREHVMNRFRSKYVQLLVATDVAARGLDVDDLTHIINYHIPTEPDIYIHRSGRTGRAGKNGISLSIIHSKEVSQLKAVEKRLGREITWLKVPGGKEICEKQLFHFIDNVERIEVDEDQIELFLPNVYKKLNWMSREDLIQRFVSIEFNRFLSYYKDLPDLDQIGEKRVKPDKKNVRYKKFHIDIGEEDHLNKRELMRYINRLKIDKVVSIGQIDIYPQHTIVELDSDYEEELLNTIPKTNYKKMQVSVEIVDTPMKKGGYQGAVERISGKNTGKQKFNRRKNR